MHLDDLDPADIAKNGSFLIDIAGQMVPFRFSALRDNGRDLLVPFDEIDDPQAAAVLVGCDLYAPPGLLADGSDESWDPEELLGLLVIDHVHGELGEVIRVDGIRSNPVLVIQHGDKEVLMPLAAELIDRIDPDEGAMHVKLPPGLVELYLG